jgi:hypothetical protein
MDARFVWDSSGCDSRYGIAEHVFHSSSMPNKVYETAESLFPCLLMTGPWMPRLQWLGGDRAAREPAAQRPRLDTRPKVDKALGELGSPRRVRRARRDRVPAGQIAKNFFAAEPGPMRRRHLYEVNRQPEDRRNDGQHHHDVP